MKKILAVVLMLSLVLVGCSAGKIVLEEDQMHVAFNSDGGVAMTMCMEDKEFEDEFDVDVDDDISDIMDDVKDYIEDQDEDVDFEVKSLKIVDDMVVLSVYVEDGKDIYMEIEDSLEDYAEYNYEDIDEMAEEEEFVYFKNGEDVDEDDVEQYEDYDIYEVSGADEGAYYTFPGKIAIVSEDMDFERVDAYTIFVEDGEYGIVVFEG